MCTTKLNILAIFLFFYITINENNYSQFIAPSKLLCSFRAKDLSTDKNIFVICFEIYKQKCTTTNFVLIVLINFKHKFYTQKCTPKDVVLIKLLNFKLN